MYWFLHIDAQLLVKQCAIAAVIVETVKSESEKYSLPAQVNIEMNSFIFGDFKLDCLGENLDALILIT